MNLDGMRVTDAIDYLLRLATTPPKQADPAPAPEEPPPAREWGFCQFCGYTLLGCRCEEGPY